ncbi:MAG: hypothetical protein BGO77_06515 [Caedibacter sp. 37-49]|nr:MAG: hypothetical protein BGO77_06515 [Caedibacter sp. 37-49]
MIALALNVLDLFLKTKERSFSWLCAVGSSLVLSGLGFGLYFGFNYFVPLFGYFETGMLLSSFLILMGVILMFATHRKKPTPVLNKALGTLKEKADDLHLKETYANHKELILAASLVTGILLPLFSRFRRGKASKNI